MLSIKKYRAVCGVSQHDDLFTLGHCKSIKMVYHLCIGMSDFLLLSDLLII